MEPITREERLIDAAAGSGASGIEPITREEQFLAYAAGERDTKPVPITRNEMFLDKLGSGGGTATPLQEKSVTITENGTTEVLPDEGYALSKVTATAQVYDAVDDRVKQLVEGTITEVSDESITKIRDCAFYNATALEVVNLPNVTSLGDEAFYNCYYFADIYFPNVTSVKARAFATATSGTPNDKPYKNANFPKLLSLSSNMFYYSRIHSISAPSATVVGESAFRQTSGLVNVNLPSVEKIETSGFMTCKSLEFLHFPKLATAGTQAFHHCTALKTVILGRIDTCCTLTSSNAFTNTPFASGGAGGIVLCPRNLIESYQTATNWSTLYAAGTCLFWALEDYTVDGTTTGEIDWDKLNTDRATAFPEGGTEA